MAKVKEPTHIPLLCSGVSGTEMVWEQAGFKTPNYSTPIPFSLPASSHGVQGLAHLGWERLIPVPTLHMTQPAQSDVSTPPNFTPDTGIGSAMANRKFLETHWNFGGKVTPPTHPPAPILVAGTCFFAPGSPARFSFCKASQTRDAGRRQVPKVRTDLSQCVGPIHSLLCLGR